MKSHQATVRQMMLLGCLSAAPEDRLTSGRKHVTVFSVATYHRDQTGDIHTDHTRCVAFDKVGEQVLKANEGDFVYAQGDFRDRRWRDPQGTTKTTQELTVTSFRILTPAQAESMQLLSAPTDSNPSTEPNSVPGIPPAGKTMDTAAPTA